MEIRELKNPAENGFFEAWKLYEDSFPKKERRSQEDHCSALTDPQFHASSVWECEKLVAIFFYWELPQFCYAEHFAVSPELRNNGYGARVLKLYCGKLQHIVLEIETPDTELSARRKAFYERNGFLCNDYFYVHPSFHADTLPHRLLIMSYPDVISKRQFDELFRYVRTYALQYSGRPVTLDEFSSLKE